MKKMIKATDGLNSKQRIKIAKASQDPKELSRLAYDNSRLVRLAVLKNENTPQKVVNMLAQEFADDGDKWARIEVAERTDDDKLLWKLADDESVLVRSAVAKRTTDEKLLAKLADDHDEDVRLAVAGETNDEKVLWKLADDDYWRVRSSVAGKTTDEELLWKLSNDKDKWVRSSVALKTNDEKLLQKLADDEDAATRSLVAKRTNDQKLLAKLADDDDWWVRKVLVERIDNPEILTKLADDRDEYVRRKVAERTDDGELLAKLVDDENKWVRQAARRRLKELNLVPAKQSTSKKSAQTDWSIPLYVIENYSEIEDEIDAVIDQAANAFAKKYHNGTATITSPDGAYDNGGTITLEIRNADGETFTYDIDAEEILAPATSQNKKQNCVKKVIAWLEQNLE